MKNLTLLTLFFAFFITTTTHAQTSTVKPDRACINCPTDEPDASAVLEIIANDKGILIPRVANTAAVSSLTTGLLIYDNSENNFKYYNGTNWIEFGGNGQSSEFGHNNSATGNFSTTVGSSNVATGSHGTTLGYANDATGIESTATGYANDAQGNQSTALGRSNEATTFGSTAVGYNNNATGGSAVAYGFRNTASGANSIAIGHSSLANSSSALAIGDRDTASNINATAIGILNKASGNQSTSIGNRNEASNDKSTAIGYSNVSSGVKTLAVGNDNIAASLEANAFGYNNIVNINTGSVHGNAFGSLNTVEGDRSLAYGRDNEVDSDYGGAFGHFNMVSSDSSSAVGYRNEAAGDASTAFGIRNLSSGSATTALGYENEAEGTFSVALGYKNTAVNTRNTAVGISNSSTGFENTAIGYNNQAEGLFYNTALGHSNISLNLGSTAVGYRNRAYGLGSNAFGEENAVDTMLSSSGGNAFGSYNLVDGVNSLACGRENEVDSDYGATFGHLNVVMNDSSSAVGYKNQAAGKGNTAVGYLNETSGSWSSAVGAENQATVIRSSAFGYNNQASGSESSAFGYETNATATGSSAFGQFATASAFNSVAVGQATLASGDFSSAFGNSTNAPLFRMTAIGTYNETPSGSSTTWVATQPVFVVGNGENDANRSTALTILKNGNTGIGTTTPTNAQFIVESAEYDDAIDENIAVFSKSTTGTAYANIKLLANGHAGIKFIDEGNGSIGESDFMIKLSSVGNLEIRNADNADDEFSSSDLIAHFETLSDTYQFTVFGDALASGGTWTNSDRRLKKNIKSLDNPLEKIMQLKPKQYDFDYKNSKFQYLNLPEEAQIGLIAQEVEKVFPELVKTDRGAAPNTDKNEVPDENAIKEIEDLKAVNYTALIPVLIGAVQEQQNQIEAKEEVIQDLEVQNTQLEERLAKIETQLAQLSTLQTTKIQLENNTNSNDLPQLQQNQPNPFSDHTIIQYFIPENVQQAQLQFHDMNGKVLKVMEISQKGSGQIELETAALISGTYSYSLILDGKVFETKRMVLSR